MNTVSDVLHLRVRYSETDQMGTFYNARALEWFECGRTELMRRRFAISYVEMEQRGVMLPLVEAHLEFQGRASYDDLLAIESRAEMFGRARLKFEVGIAHVSTGKPVVRGYTIHAFIDREGRPVRPPVWFTQMMAAAAEASRSR